jgi:type II restriction enzyme
MNLNCDQNIASKYRSPLQRARVISEHWFGENAYCLACNSDHLARAVANTKATDFSCGTCGHRYELKTFTRRPHKSIVDGAYASLIAQIESSSAPTLCLLERNESWCIRSLSAIHSSFLTPWVIEQRAPLRETARRAGWVGCKIRLDRISVDGEIDVIRNGIVLPKSAVRGNFKRYLPLENFSADRRGWATLTLKIVRSLFKPRFSLSDLYEREALFAAIYPGNRHIRAKIRQQLQLLRDLGVIRFESRGFYSLIA